MNRSKKSRHTNAFILLFLQESSSSYGAQILSSLQSDLPYCLTDSPSVYRALQEMEEKGWLKSSWKTPETGPPRKWYEITPQGQSALHDYAIDIAKRKANFDFFLEHYTGLSKHSIFRKEHPDEF
ncbi:putative transcriptional regulator [Desulfosporosinus orientis DSM 765]|uniref:Putative transcriptional regulator n=1 Tax=Desulfosporosinus orientis (strain ATCC 19365 / DSM 765 / NCIMB 8382 / VKM B-1628 / Singapore I) TaxID=768706 RepID=G7WFQ4_DESOD|nr:PadR family transcriptional regulator [Desulfosporosinus orientis]AET68927.1 putative transcriptional regulator [Desulfosporosinus orientis DSM 765]